MTDEAGAVVAPDVIAKGGNVAASVPLTDRVRIIACGAIAREVIAICRSNGLKHIDLVCLPAIWHNHPQKIAGRQATLI